MIISTNEIETFEVKKDNYTPSKKTILLRPVKNCEGQLTELTINGKKIIVDSANLVIAARNCKNTGSGLKEEFDDFNDSGIVGIFEPELKV